MTGWLLAAAVAVGIPGEAAHPVTDVVRGALTANGGSAEDAFTLVVRIETDEADAVIEALSECAKPTRKEEGNIRYQLHRSADEPDTFLLYERWQHIDRLDAHLKAEHTKKLLEVLDEKANIELQVMRPIDAAGE